MTAARAGDGLASASALEAEFERFAADLVGITRRTLAVPSQIGASSRDSRPLISAEYIYERALHLVDEEGIDALTVRRLAADLKISTRTLYKRIESRTCLVRKLGDLFASRLVTEPRDCASWRITASNWCLDLHRKLMSHPHLVELGGNRDPSHMSIGVGELTQTAVEAGLLGRDAAELCETPASVTLNDALAMARSCPYTVTDAVTDRQAATVSERNLMGPIGLILDGVQVRTQIPGLPSPSTGGPRESAARGRSFPGDRAIRIYRTCISRSRSSRPVVVEPHNPREASHVA